ncbi:acyltransferase 3 [Mycolicibacterium canariasense]|uniref:Acyltransferase 3 n=1 Tax=Mycolicibacterium canariasense TaxID=228230 RepID=A0A100WCP5_MYCCR|nr:acyltransferase [Mycolicibacterium canariasense]MCV7207031.1 acyltransferase [Mycolicibacterium canariasense]GAS95766.1 acyltransferase 3 [Mycolicibacterium canariasense]
MTAGPSTQLRGPATAPARDSASRQASLTGLRALAALMVVGTHASFATGALGLGYLGALLGHLDIGVPIFFALSGFLLFRPWVVAARRGTAAPRLHRYALARIRRIMPGYVAAVLFTYVVYLYFTPGPNPGQTWQGLLRHLTLTQIYTDNYLVTYLHPGLSQMWSLAVEASFYAALPLLAYLLLGRRRRPAALLAGLAALAAVAPVWLAMVVHTDWLPNSAGMWLPAHLAAFAGGMALAVIQQTGFRVRVGVALSAAALGYLTVATSVGENPLTRAVLYAGIAMAILAPLALGDSGGWTRFLGSRPMVWLGGISYEIFLLHVVMMAIAMHLVLGWPLFTGSAIVLAVVTLALTVPLAWLLREVTVTRRPAAVPERR